MLVKLTPVWKSDWPDPGCSSGLRQGMDWSVRMRRRRCEADVGRRVRVGPQHLGLRESGLS